MKTPWSMADKKYHDDFSTVTLRLLILAVALLLIGAVIFVRNKWLLAGIVAYVTLP